MTATLDVSVVGSAVSGIEPISLEELNQQAALQTRVDRKYVLPLGEVEDLLQRIGESARVLEISELRSFGYESVYFDTLDWASYLLAAYRRRRRFKIRTRTYVDSGKCWLEVKTRGSRGSTVKNRIPYSLGHTTTLAPGRTFVDSILTRDSIPGSSTMTFLPTLTTQYRRTTLFIPETLSRATIDTELMWEDPEHRRLRMPDRAIVETKTGSSPSGVDRLLWSRGYRPIRISKYATGLAALRPDLPSSRWQRTLRRHFACAGPPGMPMAFNWFNASCREPASCEQGSWQ